MATDRNCNARKQYKLATMLTGRPVRCNNEACSLIQDFQASTSIPSFVALPYSNSMIHGKA